MKKLLTLTALGGLLTTPATAVQKCVALNSNDTTCIVTELGLYKAEWGMTCTTNGTSVPIKGIGACSNVAGSAAGDIYSDGALPTVSSASDTTNINCWCKIISPAESSWVFYTTESSSDACAANCALYCANGAASASAFQSAILGSLEK